MMPSIGPDGGGGTYSGREGDGDVEVVVEGEEDVGRSASFWDTTHGHFFILFFFLKIYFEFFF